MSRSVNRDKTVRPLPMKWPLGLVLLLLAPFAVAQKNLGELLDAGATKLTADQFRQDVVQHVIVGPSPTRGSVQLVYGSSGMVQGRIELPPGTAIGVPWIAPIDGVWNIDERGRTCTSMVLGKTTLPFRCQSWFKYKDDYFVADSEDRAEKVLRRTVQQ
jgi:hypothetical protein